MKYITKFVNSEAYYNAKSNLILPNVSLDSNEEIIFYNPYVEPITVHEYVDLGLPSGTLWATMNIGATNELEFGNYYQFGKGSRQYSETYEEEQYIETESTLQLSVDTAKQTWGGEWHIPTKEQWEELKNNCDWHWYTPMGTNNLNPICNYYFGISNNGNTLYLPYCGYYNEGTLQGTAYMMYLSSTPGSTSSQLYFTYGYGNSVYIYQDTVKNYGFSVRPVLG